MPHGASNMQMCAVAEEPQAQHEPNALDHSTSYFSLRASPDSCAQGRQPGKHCPSFSDAIISCFTRMLRSEHACCRGGNPQGQRFEMTPCGRAPPKCRSNPLSAKWSGKCRHNTASDLFLYEIWGRKFLCRETMLHVWKAHIRMIILSGISELLNFFFLKKGTRS